MTVCYFGVYTPDFIRNKVLISGLEQNDVKVIECQDQTPGLKKFFNLFKKHWQIRKDYDVLIVGFSSQLMVPFARLLTRKKVVMDALVPLYDALVFNHKLFGPRSIKARYYWFLDWLAVRLADFVLTDTNEQINFYCKNFSIKKSKCGRSFVGANNEIFYPRQVKKKEEDKNKFIVEFHAFVYSEHGIEYIVKAAQILKKSHPDVLFRMIGASRMYDEGKNMAQNLGLKNMDFVGRKPLQEIPYFIAESDVCLGLFGETNKTQRVIPNKAFEIIACRKPYINADTPGIKEVFTNKVDCLLCKSANAQSLVDAIITLKDDKRLRDKIAQNGYELFQKKLTPKKVGENFKNILNNLII